MKSKKTTPFASFDVDNITGYVNSLHESLSINLFKNIEKDDSLVKFFPKITENINKYLKMFCYDYLYIMMSFTEPKNRPEIIEKEIKKTSKTLNT